jgi:ribosomal protein S18 acetylase RimI-like enzyme
MKLSYEVKTRYITRDDMGRINEIDHESKNDIAALLKSAEIVNGMVAVNDTDDVIGFCIYSLENPETFHILHLAVDDRFYRLGIATKLIDRMKSKLNDKRNILEYEVPESYLAMHLFLKAMNFKARVVRNREEDIFKFTYMEQK